ncbi:MAG: hypothetical protein E7159_03425 [Firmicutes bacterium]|nr:hypothetical protein [Bacillota bacterium]
MKLINSDFQECQDTNNSFANIYNQVIEYLKTTIDDEQLLSQVINNCNHSIVQLTDGNSYTILAHDGTFKKYKYRDSSAAFKTNMAISVKENEISIIPGIALRPNYNKHQVIHELLHVISSNQHNYFNEEGIAYTKTGTRIDYYDKGLNDYNMENNPSSDGLNEGITELLASIITNEYTGNYPGYLAVASLLMSCNNQLLNAYFSSDTSTLESFYNDLEEKQSVISRDDLCKLDSKELDDAQLLKLIVGAIRYNNAYNNTVDMNGITNYLDKFYMLDNGSWNDLILSSLNTYEENDTITSMSR